MTFKRIMLFLLIIILFSCNKNGKILPENTGKQNEVILVIEDKLWGGNKGKILKEVFEKEIEGIYQSEKLFKLIQINSKEFSRFFKTHKNIIFVSSYKKDSYDKNKWAKDQTVVYLNSDSEETDFRKSCQETFNFLDRKEIEQIKNNYKKGYNENASLYIKEEFGFEIFLPAEYTVSLKKDRVFISDFHSFNEKQDLLKYIIVHEFKPTDYELQEEEVVIKTDSVLKQYILGSIEGSYVQIDNQIPLIEDNGIYKGLWFLKNGFMGGPIIIKTRHVEDKIVVSLGIIFHPNENKRNFVRTFEAIL